MPVFAVATVRDHVSPWRSVYKIHLLTDTEVTFLLTSGGHNAGIVSEPGHRNRSDQVGTRGHGVKYVDPEMWHATTPTREGSWWPEWSRWLAAHSTGQARPPAIGAAHRGYVPLADAPGQYVLAPWRLVPFQLLSPKQEGRILGRTCTSAVLRNKLERH